MIRGKMLPTQPAEKRCPQCGQLLSFRLGEYECTACDYREAAAPPVESSFGLARSTPGQAGAVPPPPPPGSSFYSTVQPVSVSSSGGGATDRLEREKRGFTAGMPMMLITTLLYSYRSLNNPFARMLGDDPAARAGMDPGAFHTLVFLFFTVQIAGVIAALVLLHIDEAWAKWFGALGAVLAIGVALLSLGSQGIGVIAGDLQLFIVFLDVCLMAWLFSIFVRELKALQPVAGKDE